jgi:hypothetical protein
MSSWPELLRIPDYGIDAWFAAVAERLLNGAELRARGESYRLAEIEFYLYSVAHPDPYSHRDPLGFQLGRWYLHRSHGAYRGGTFKGFDLTFGNGTACGGILIRSLVKPDGTVISGPSLCVDQVLRALGVRTVAELDRAVAGHVAWDTDNPLSLRQAGSVERRQDLCTPRVGLSLRRARQFGEMTRYLMRPYRFLSEPRLVRKGKRQMVLAMYARGDDVETIRRVTGCPAASIRRYVEEFEAGRRETDFGPYLGVEAGPREWCRMYGLWERVYGLRRT